MANFSHDWPEFPQAVALGLVPGFRALRKFGRNDDIDGNEEMWEMMAVLQGQVPGA